MGNIDSRRDAGCNLGSPQCEYKEGFSNVTNSSSFNVETGLSTSRSFDFHGLNQWQFGLIIGAGSLLVIVLLVLTYKYFCKSKAVGQELPPKSLALNTLAAVSKQTQESNAPANRESNTDHDLYLTQKPDLYGEYCVAIEVTVTHEDNSQ